MRRLRLATPLLAMALLTVSACAELKPKPPVVVCPRVPQAPSMDGQIDPAEWAAAGCLSDFMLLGAAGLPELPTRAYVMHTRNALYIGAQMYDRTPLELTADVTERDGKVYEDDCLEIFLDTEATHKDYAHFVVNSLGTKFDEYGHDVAENFDWNVFAAVNDTGWAVEMELPFDREIPPLEGETWSLAICRNAAHVGELSTWSRHERDFHEPAALGELVFAAPLLTARVDDLGDRLLGDNLALVTVENLALASGIAKLNAVVMGSDRRSHYFGTVKKEVPGRSSTQIYIPYKVRRCGPAWMALSLTDEKGAVAWRSAAFPIELPDVSDPLDDVAHSIALSWKAWAHLERSKPKENLRLELEMLQKEWSYLDTQMAAATGVAIVRLSAMGLEVRGLKAKIEAMRSRIEAVASGAAGESEVGLAPLSRGVQYSRTPRTRPAM